MKKIKGSKKGGDVKEDEADPEAKGYYRQVTVKQASATWRRVVYSE